MRTFTLINENGTEYNLTAKGTAFFYGIDGLGFDKKLDFQQVDERFLLTTAKIAQNSVKGSVQFFQPGAVNEYFEFAKFCQGKLRMKYNPGHGVYYRDGYVKTIGRNDGKDIRIATIDFVCTSPWYKVISQFNNGAVSGGKTYDYEYDYEYTSATPGSIMIDSDTMQESPVKFTIFGPSTNPSWRHYVDGQLKTTGKINGSISVNHVLVIDTTVIPWSIKQFDSLGNLVADMYQNSDFSTERFIRLGNGRNVITVDDDGIDTLTIKAEAQIEYDTV